jgi:ABC-type multidrug transport system ATPase subunit
MLCLSNISKKYGSKIALNNFSLDVNIGDCIGVVGRNGAGKTTLFNIISDLLPPDEGQVLYNGTDIIKNYPTALKKKIGVFLHADLLIEEINAYEYLHFLAQLYEIENANNTIVELLQYLFDKPDELKLPIKTYSFGMKQKVLLIGALMHKPELLILDEPFNGLDVFSCKKMLALLKDILPATMMLIASHNLSYIQDIATKILVLDDGKTLYKGEKSDFVEKGKGEIATSLFELIDAKTEDDRPLNFISGYEKK